MPITVERRARFVAALLVVAALVGLTGSAVAAPIEARLIEARLIEAAPGGPAPTRVEVVIEVRNPDAGARPVKPMPFQVSSAGQRMPEIEIDIGRVSLAAARGDQPAGAPFEMMVPPGEAVRVRLPSVPLAETHPLRGMTSAQLSLTLVAPQSPRITLRGALTVGPPPAPPGPAMGASGPKARPDRTPRRPMRLQPYPAPGFARGVVYSSWDGTYPHADRWRADLEHFEALGVNWIEVLTFAHQPKVTGPEIKLMPPESWPRQFVTEARQRGFRILIKPHVWSQEFYDGSNRWRGSITMPDEATWERWFESYTRFILREARFAAETGADLFSIGLEYVEATRGPQRAKQWKAMIEQIRAVYPGPLTYAADGNHEARHVEFWDALDVIGVDAYFDVGEPRLPGGADLLMGWAPHVAWMKALSEAHGKPIIYTEAGFPSVVGATRRPWKWPDGSEAVDQALQATAYDVLMRACTQGAWCQGVFWWKYYEKPERGTSHAHDYSPRNKPAEAVLRRWYRGDRPDGAAKPNPGR